MSTSTELTYVVLHLCSILFCWIYQLCVYFCYLFFYNSLQPMDKAILDHEYIIVTCNETLFIRLGRLLYVTLYFFFPRLGGSNSNALSHLRAERADDPSAAFLRLVRNVPRLRSPSKRPHGVRVSSLEHNIKNFWYRGVTDASIPDHFLFGGRWHIKDIPDPREKLGHDPFLCAIAASMAEQMVEVFNWRIETGARRDLRMLESEPPYWDKDLEPCVLESAPGWCDDIGPISVTTVVDREAGKDTARGMQVGSRIIHRDLSPSFKKRNLLADSQFMYFD